LASQARYVHVRDLQSRIRGCLPAHPRSGSEKHINLEPVLEVLDDDKAVFQKDPDGAARDHAGVSILTVHDGARFGHRHVQAGRLDADFENM
jgi:hypothetical protein